MRFVGLAVVLLTTAAAAPAAAQQRRPLPVMVVDLRGFYSPLGQDPVTADGLLLPPSALPGRGVGGTFGVHFYPLRRRTISLGVGAEAIIARGRSEADVEAGETPPPPVIQRIRGLAGSLSLNFGSRDGWSYVSAGMGPLSFGTHVGDEAPATGPPASPTINFGAGARWFAWRHFAFTFDIRFYQTRPEEPQPPYPARGRSSLRVMSAGISIR